MGGSKSEEFLATAENGEDTYVRCTHLRLRRQRRGRRRCRAARSRSPYDDAPAAHAEQTPDTPTIETLVDHLNEKFPREDRPWNAGDTLKNVLVVLKHPDGTREPIAIGLPGDREVDEKRLEGQLEPTEVEAFDEEDFAKHPVAGQGLHRARRAGGEERVRHPLPRRPAHRRGHPLGHRRRRVRLARARPGRRSRLHARRHHRGRRGPRRRPLPRTATAPCTPPAASRWATSSRSAASTPTPSASRCSTRTASWSRSRWAPTASASPGPSRAIAENTHDELGLVWPREVAPADVHLVATGKDPAVFDAAAELAVDLTARGLHRAVRRPRRRSRPA